MSLADVCKECGVRLPSWQCVASQINCGHHCGSLWLFEECEWCGGWPHEVEAEPFET